MAVTVFASTFNPILKDDGTVNSGGTVTFYETDGATAKNVYSDKDLTVSLGNIATLTSAGTKTIFLNGDYDCVIKDSTGATIRTLENINPDSSGDEIISNLILNGNFENVSNNLPTNWTLFEWNSGANVVDSTDQYNGKYSMKFVSIGSGGGYQTSSSFEIGPDVYLTVSFALKSTADVLNKVQVLWYDKDLVSLSSTDVYSEATSNPTDWREKSYTIKPLSTAKFGKIRIIGADSSDATAGTVRYDDIKVTIRPRHLQSRGLINAIHNNEVRL